MVFQFFTNPRDPDLSQTTKTLKTWVQEELALTNEAIVRISQIHCTEPSCPGVETVILVFEPNQATKMLKIGKPMVFVRKWDIKPHFFKEKT
ncbi:MAG: hypothetical protein NZ551_08835 [Microscillaceae bacterium]|nr:hypothetical protein [Microscillaceae bacterium]MDW8461305.1 hypothetical protein [Cytophagales bacterium]